MSTLFDDPMVQAGLAPFVVALLVAALLGRTRLSGLAIVAGLVTTLMLSTGISFSPLSASRKIVLLVLLAPALALALDVFLAEAPKPLPWLLAAVLGGASAWVFQSVLSQREGAAAWALGVGVAVFVALLGGLMLRLRGDNLAGGSAALGIGLAVGVSAILSASLGNMMNGVALAAAGGALLLWRFIGARATPAGWTLTLTAGTAAALWAAATFVLAEQVAAEDRAKPTDLEVVLDRRRLAVALHAVQEAEAQAHRQREAPVLALELEALARHESLRLAVGRRRAQALLLVARQREARCLVRRRRPGGGRGEQRGEQGERGEGRHARRKDARPGRPWVAQYSRILSGKEDFCRRDYAQSRG